MNPLITSVATTSVATFARKWFVRLGQTFLFHALASVATNVPLSPKRSYFRQKVVRQTQANLFVPRSSERSSYERSTFANVATFARKWFDRLGQTFSFHALASVATNVPLSPTVATFARKVVRQTRANLFVPRTGERSYIRDAEATNVRKRLGNNFRSGSPWSPGKKTP